MLKRYFIFGLGCLLLLLGVLSSEVQAALEKEVTGVVSGGLSTADHSRFAELDKPFASGPEVTNAC
ncbi:MAG: cytochrome C, partial [Pseudomonadota bacterium]|nr:cytochrome C [Pseudomonadota bacterium]